MRKILLVVIFLASLFFTPSNSHAQTSTDGPLPMDTFARGHVLDVLSETEKEEYNLRLLIQDLRVEIKNGTEKGKIVYIINEIETNRLIKKIQTGDKIIVGKSQLIEADEPVYYVSDRYRLNALLWVFLFFVGTTLLLARKHGARAFAGLTVSFAVILLFLVPQIAAGKNPVLLSLLSALFIITTSLYIAHGFKITTHISAVSTTLTVSLAFVLGFIFIRILDLFGLGTEEAFYLQVATTENLDLSGILLAGMILGTLGVLDDVTTAQAATVAEIHDANPKLSFSELYRRGSVVGREHIVAVVNTLVLAYTGTALPLLLLFSFSDQPIWMTLNSEIIIEEIARMLVGSIALISAVPIATLLTAWYFDKKRSQ